MQLNVWFGRYWYFFCFPVLSQTLAISPSSFNSTVTPSILLTPSAFGWIDEKCLRWILQDFCYCAATDCFYSLPFDDCIRTVQKQNLNVWNPTAYVHVHFDNSLRKWKVWRRKLDLYDFIFIYSSSFHWATTAIHFHLFVCVPKENLTRLHDLVAFLSLFWSRDPVKANTSREEILAFTGAVIDQNLHGNEQQVLYQCTDV